MQKIIRLSLIDNLFTAIASSCGNTSKKEKEGALNDKKAELKNSKREKEKLMKKLQLLKKILQNWIPVQQLQAKSKTGIIGQRLQNRKF